MWTDRCTYGQTKRQLYALPLGSIIKFEARLTWNGTSSLPVLQCGEASRTVLAEIGERSGPIIVLVQSARLAAVCSQIEAITIGAEDCKGLEV